MGGEVKSMVGESGNLNQQVLLCACTEWVVEGLDKVCSIAT